MSIDDSAKKVPLTTLPFHFLFFCARLAWFYFRKVLFGKRRPAPTVPSSSRLDGGENKDAPVASNTEGAEGIPDNGHGAKSRRRIASKKRGTSASPSGGATASPTSGGDANEEAGAASAVDLDRSRTKGGFFWDNVSNMWFNPDTQYYYNKDTKVCFQSSNIASGQNCACIP